MNKNIIVANWKMYATSVADAHILTTSVRNNLSGLQNLEVVIAPPTIWLTEVAGIIGASNQVFVGVQNMFYEPEGPYTGEISPLMVKEVAKFVIIGHSERREHFGETDLEINEKVLSALKAGLTPIVCVGEEKKGSDLSLPLAELKAALDQVPKKYYRDIIVAYEPIWAISNGRRFESAPPEYVAKAIVKLREIVHSDTRIIYGGSVNSKDVAGFAKRPEIDGVLVGSASTRAAEFIKICKIWSEEKGLYNHKG